MPLARWPLESGSGNECTLPDRFPGRSEGNTARTTCWQSTHPSPPSTAQGRGRSSSVPPSGLAWLSAARGPRSALRLPGAWSLCPAAGLRCNPSKSLLDPYAKAIDGRITWNEVLFDYRFGDPDSYNDADSAPYGMTSVVANPFFDWADDRPLRIPYQETVIYEAHVKGMTMRHPQIPDDVRGSYAGLAHPVMIKYFRELGVTAVELMPVHQFVHDSTLAERGLSNYWGYNTIGFFAPHNDYACFGTRGQQVHEFKAMVRSLHRAGIEVILHVVYNHTAEGNHLGPRVP